MGHTKKIFKKYISKGNGTNTCNGESKGRRVRENLALD